MSQTVMVSYCAERWRSKPIRGMGEPDGPVVLEGSIGQVGHRLAFHQGHHNTASGQMVHDLHDLSIANL